MGRTGRAIVTAILTCCVAVAITPGVRPTDAAIKRYAKDLDVAKLDASLPSQTLEQWLRKGPPRVKSLAWDVDCQMKPDGPEPKGGWPICITVRWRRDDLFGEAVIIIGNTRDGIRGSPWLRIADVSTVKTRDFKIYRKLSELPHLMQETEEENRHRK